MPLDLKTYYEYDPTSALDNPLEPLVAGLPHKEGAKPEESYGDSQEILDIAKYISGRSGLNKDQKTALIELKRALDVAQEIQDALAKIKDSDPTEEQRLKIAALKLELGVYAHGFDFKMPIGNQEIIAPVWEKIEAALHHPLVEQLQITAGEALAAINIYAIPKENLKRIDLAGIFPAGMELELRRLELEQDVLSDDQELSPEEYLTMKTLRVAEELAGSLRVRMIEADILPISGE